LRNIWNPLIFKDKDKQKENKVENYLMVMSIEKNTAAEILEWLEVIQFSDQEKN